MVQTKVILVTGGAGYIGSHISCLLVQQGHSVIILDNFSQGQMFEHAWAQIIPGDYGDKALVEHIFKTYDIDAVVHCGAYAVVSESVQDPEKYYYNNVEKTRVLLTTMLAHGVQKFVFSSSCAVYGIPEEVPIPEGHKKNPVNPYGNTKLAVEMMLQDFSNAYDLQFVALRYFNAIGASPEVGLYEWHQPETHVVPLLLQALYFDKPFYIFGNDYPTPDGTCLRDYVHVLDIADAHSKALLHLDKKLPSDFFNLGLGVGTSVQELVTLAQDVCDKKVQLVYANRREGDPAVLVANPAKAHTILQWKPRITSIAQALKSAHISAQQMIQSKIVELR